MTPLEVATAGVVLTADILIGYWMGRRAVQWQERQGMEVKRSPFKAPFSHPKTGPFRPLPPKKYREMKEARAMEEAMAQQ